MVAFEALPPAATPGTDKETWMAEERGREVVIVEAARTPIGRGHPEKGYYKDTHPNELLGAAYRAVTERAGIEAGQVENVIAGCGAQFGPQGLHGGRNA